ncbi:MAG: biotin/lipoyl-containing protein, partial [Candidatus Dormibacteraceae bacterium]
MGLSPVKMPQLGESVTEGTVDHWLKSEGDWVERDEPLVQVVTDKVNAEIPSPVAGRLTKIEIQEGTTVPVGSDLALIETTAATPDGQPQAPGSSQLDARLSRTTPSIVPATSAGPGSHSPAVRKLARENGLDVDQIAGSGSGGRVTRDDVVAHLNSLAAPTPSPVLPEPPDGGT